MQLDLEFAHRLRAILRFSGRADDTGRGRASLFGAGGVEYRHWR